MLIKEYRKQQKKKRIIREQRRFLEKRFGFGRNSMKEVSPSFITEAFKAIIKIIKNEK